VELAEMAAISYEKTSNFSASAKYYEKVTAMGGKKKQKQYGFHLAGIYEKLGQNEQAMFQYRMNIKRFPKMYENHEALANHYLKRNELSNAVVLLAPAIRVGAPASLNKPLAIAYRKLKENGNAAKAYERYVIKVKTDSTAWSELGKIYYDMKKYGKAIRPLTKASALMPKDKWVHYKLASSYMHLKKAKDAQAVVLKVWPSYRTDKDIHKIFSAILAVTKDTVVMIDVYTERSKLETNNFNLNVKLGDLLVSVKKVDEGIKAYERALAIKAGAFKVRQTLIAYYTKKGNDPIVYTLVQDGLKLHGNSAVLYQQRAAYYLRAKELSKAKNDLKKSVSLNSNNGPAYFTLGMVYKELKELENSRSALKKATSIEAKNSEYRIELSRVLVQLNRLTEAMAEGDVILKLVPKDYKAVSEVATIFDKAKKYEKAEKLYINALALNDSCIICYRNLGIIYYERGSYDLAEPNLDNFCKKDSGDAIPSLYLGNLKRGNGDEDYALTLFRRAHNSDPKNDEMLFRYVNMLCEVGNVAEAKQVISKRGGSNKSAWVFVAEGRVQEATEKYKQAISLYNMGLKMNEEIGDAYLGLGRIQMLRKDFNGGIETFGRAMGYDPTNVETFILLGKVYLNLKDYHSAEGILLEGTNVNSKNPDVYYYLAMSYSRNRKHDKAVSVLRKALTYNPESANINYALAVELSEDIKPKESIKRFERTLEYDKKKEFELKIYKIMGDIYYEQLLDNEGAKVYYKKYIKSGGADKGVKEKLKSL
jgi:tetratricopeptide (TPR) repeat protein